MRIPPVDPASPLPLEDGRFVLPRPIMRIPRDRSRPASLGLVLLLGACSTYPDRTAEPFRDFQRGHLGGALAGYADEDEVGSEFLSGAEAGMVAFTAGDWSRAQNELGMAAAEAQDIEGRALANPERLGETLASWAVNDTARSYEGEGFERVYVHALLAQTYLAQGLLEDAGVEARRANELLESEEELYDTRYRAGGLGHFMSALVYELMGEPDQAFIDYRRMEEKGLGAQLAGSALVRLASQLHRDDTTLLVGRHGPELVRPRGAANVVVIAGVGLGPYKVEGRLPIPTRDGLIPIAVPDYEFRTQLVRGLRLVDLESGAGVLTERLEDVSNVASRNLKHRIAWITSKSVARGVLKREVSKALRHHFGELGFLVGNLYAFFSERADLRCWRTLPDTWQACRLFVPPGVRSFHLEALGGQSRYLGSFALDPGETLLVFARTVGTRLHAHVVGGRPVLAGDDSMPFVLPNAELLTTPSTPSTR